jgi:hypothetical protein
VADIALKIEPDSGLLTALLSGTAPNTIVVFRQIRYVPVAIRFDAPAGFSFRKLLAPRAGAAALALVVATA